MAALGWLVRLAQKKGPAKGDEVVAEIRKAGEKTPADVRALWDWFYLCLIRYDNAAVYQAGKALSKAAPTDPAGPLGLSLFARRPANRTGPAVLRLPGSRSKRTRRRRSKRTSSITSWPATARSRPAAPSWSRPRSFSMSSNELKRAKRSR